MPSPKTTKRKAIRKRAPDPLFSRIKAEIEAAKEKLAEEKKQTGLTTSIKRRHQKLKDAHRSLFGKIDHIWFL